MVDITNTELKVNEYITLRLEGEETKIYIKNCEKILNCFYNDSFISQAKTSEEAFKLICSDFTEWVQGNYSYTLLHDEYVFVILEYLYKSGDPIARKVFKKEIINGFRSDDDNTLISLIDYNFHEYLADSSDFDFESFIKNAFKKRGDDFILFLAEVNKIDLENLPPPEKTQFSNIVRKGCLSALEDNDSEEFTFLFSKFVYYMNEQDIFEVMNFKDNPIKFTIETFSNLSTYKEFEQKFLDNYWGRFKNEFKGDLTGLIRQQVFDLANEADINQIRTIWYLGLINYLKKADIYKISQRNEAFKKATAEFKLDEHTTIKLEQNKSKDSGLLIVIYVNNIKIRSENIKDRKFDAFCLDYFDWVQSWYQRSRKVLDGDVEDYYIFLQSLYHAGEPTARKVYKRILTETIKNAEYSDSSYKFLISEDFISDLSLIELVEGILIPEEAEFLLNIIRRTNYSYHLVIDFEPDDEIRHRTRPYRYYFSTHKGHLTELDFELNKTTEKFLRSILSLKNLRKLHLFVYGFDEVFFKTDQELESLNYFYLYCLEDVKLPDLKNYFPNLINSKIFRGRKIP